MRNRGPKGAGLQQLRVEYPGQQGVWQRGKEESSSAYPLSGRGGNRSRREIQTSFTPVTLSSWEIQAREDT